MDDGLFTAVDAVDLADEFQLELVVALEPELLAEAEDGRRARERLFRELARRELGDFRWMREDVVDDRLLRRREAFRFMHGFKQAHDDFLSDEIAQAERSEAREGEREREELDLADRIDHVERDVHDARHVAREKGNRDGDVERLACQRRDVRLRDGAEQQVDAERDEEIGDLVAMAVKAGHGRRLLSNVVY